MSGSYTIPISGLKEGCHSHKFELGKEFFGLFEESEIREGELIVSVEADRRVSHIDIMIRIKGTVMVSCDRCLGVFSLPVNSENRLLVKFDKSHDETDPDIISMSAEETELDLTLYLYEYIQLALPIQRIHPEDEKGNSTCDPEMISKLNEHIINEDIGTDPRWDELKRIMNN